MILNAYQFEAGAQFEYMRFEEKVTVTVDHVRIFANANGDVAAWVEWSASYSVLGEQKSFDGVHTATQFSNVLENAKAEQTHYPQVGFVLGPH